MTDVSRLILAHPDLGTAGGAGLHASITAMYKKIGDNMSSRMLIALSVGNGATTTLEHDFRDAFADMRYDLYTIASTDPYDFTRVTATSSPSLSQFTIAANGTFPTTKIDVTNNSGSSRSLCLVVHLDPIKLSEGDVQDVDVSTTAPVDGDQLSYSGASSKWAPGGERSFKIQTIATPNATLKGGYIALTDGRELSTYSGSGSSSTSYAVDLTLNLTTIFGGSPVNATNYYLYIDLNSLGAVQTISDNGRKIYRITQSNFILSVTTPETVLTLMPSRYVPIGNILSATTGTAWSGSGAGFATFSTKKHHDGIVLDGTVSPSDGQALIYDAATGKYKPSSGISTSLNQFNMDIGDSSNLRQPTDTSLLGVMKSTTGTFTFVDGDVNTGTDTITHTAHGMLSGDRGYLTTTGTLPAGLSPNVQYWIAKSGANAFQICSSFANAMSSSQNSVAPVNITAAAGGGTHTFHFGGIVNSPKLDYVEAVQSTATSLTDNNTGSTIVTGTRFTMLSLTSLPLGTWRLDGCVEWRRNGQTFTSEEFAIGIGTSNSGSTGLTNGVNNLDDEGDVLNNSFTRHTQNINGVIALNDGSNITVAGNSVAVDSNGNGTVYLRGLIGNFSSNAPQYVARLTASRV